MNNRLVSSLLLAASLTGCASTVSTGYRGVVLEWQKPTGEVKSEGVYMYNPFSTEIVEMNVQTNASTFNCSAFSSDTQHVSTKFTVSYHLDAARVSEIYDKFRDSIGDRLVHPAVLSACTQAASHFTATDLVAKRDQLAVEIESLLKKKIEPSGVVIDQVAITDLEFAQGFQDAVEAKVKAQQDLLTAETEAKTAVVQAEANAKSQQAQHQSLTGPLLQKMWIEKWDGHLPAYITSSNASALINLPAGK